MKNLQKLALAVMVAVMVIGFSAFTSNKSVKMAGLYYYNQTTQQVWNSTTIDQNPSHYSTYTGEPDCIIETEKICTYDLDANGKYVQSTEGTFLIP